jgi:hypothetical protein
MANENSNRKTDQSAPIESINIGRPVQGGGNMKTPPPNPAPKK